MVSTLNSRCQLGFQILGDACPHFLVLLLGTVVYYETRGRIVTIEFFGGIIHFLTTRSRLREGLF